MDATERQTFGEQIRMYRLKAGLTQEELAERAELSPRGLIYLERDERRPQPATARRLADAFGLSGEDRADFLASSEAAGGASATTRAGRAIAPVERPRGRTAILTFPRSRSDESRAEATWHRRRSLYIAMAIVAALAILAAGILIARHSHVAPSVTSTSARPIVLARLGPTSTGPYPMNHVSQIRALPGGRLAAIVARGTSEYLVVGGVAELTASGRLIWSWAARWPRFVGNSLTADSAGNIYVVDYAHKQIDKWSPDGRLIATWGAGLGLKGPSHVEIDHDGNVWVDDYTDTSARLVRLSSSGRVLATYGSRGSRPGQFESPAGIAIGRTGDIYVSDIKLNRITELTSDRALVRIWGSTGSRPGELSKPSSLATDPNGDILVVDTGNYRIQKFSPDGRLLAVWGRKGDGPDQFNGPLSVSTAPDGRIYVSDVPELARLPENVGCVGPCPPDRVEVFSPSGTFLYQWDVSALRSTMLERVSGLAVDGGGDLFAADDSTDSVVMFGPNHLPSAAWGTEGSRSGQVAGLDSIAVDGSGGVLVADSIDGRVQRFTASDRIERTRLSTRGLTGGFLLPTGVAVSPSGRAYVAEPSRGRVDVFAAGRRFLRSWPATYDADGQVGHGALATDPAGNVYVGNEASGTVDKYTPSGSFLGSFGGASASTAGLQSITGIAVDDHRRVYAVDDIEQSLSVFSPSGALVAHWTLKRYPHLGLHHLSAIAVDRAGNIYLGGGSRVVEIAPLA